MNKIFSECAPWEDDLPRVGTSFCFSQKSRNKEFNGTKNGEEGRSKNQNPQKQGKLNKPMGWSVLVSSNNRIEENHEQTSKRMNGNYDNVKGKKRKATEEWSDDNVNNNESKSSIKKGKTNGHQKNIDIPCENVDGSKTLENGEFQKLATHTKNESSKKHSIAGHTGNLREKLVERLKGSRFRFINEQLYKTTGEEAKRLFKEDPKSFAAYHEGYRHQIAQWSMNPLDRIIKNIRKLPKDTIVADFGCGEARLAGSIPNQTYSLDLVAHNSSVIACDMAHTTLESNFVNVVVFCLSLMGTNLSDFFLEANRVLKVGGILKIAEVSSRFDNVNQFVTNVKQCGFTLVNKDIKHKLFYFFTFKKDRTVIRGSIKIKQFSLKPCLYKKR